MSAKQIANASQIDVDIINAVESPTRGCSAGSGPHIDIPDDYATRIASGQAVPGCTYCRLEVDGSLFVSDHAQAQLAIPAIVSGLTAAQQTAAQQLLTKINAAVAAIGGT